MGKGAVVVVSAVLLLACGLIGDCAASHAVRSGDARTAAASTAVR